MDKDESVVDDLNLSGTSKKSSEKKVRKKNTMIDPEL